MREYEFRGQLINSKEWVFGGYSKHIKDENRHFITVMSKDHISDIGWHQEVISETIGQYTGLKDKNGKKIYEGDITQIIALSNDHHQRGTEYKLIVKYFMGNACLCEKNYETGTPIYPLCVDHTIEVIGNIYNNPELLKEESHE